MSVYLTRFAEFLFKLVHDILTGTDNATYDSGRVGMFITILYYFYLAHCALDTKNPWSPTDFATGISAIAVAFSVNMRIKEPNIDAVKMYRDYPPIDSKDKDVSNESR